MNASIRLVAGIAILLLVAGACIARGHLRLLANYDPKRVDDETRVALRSGPAGDGWWLGRTLLTIVVAFGDAAVASGGT